MKISLKLTPACNGPEYDTKDLPQDGQRLITELEDKTMKDLVDIFNKVTDDFLKSKNIRKDMYDLVVRYTFSHGHVPRYFTTRFYVTHLLETHKGWHQIMMSLPYILDDYFSKLNK